MSLSLPNEPFVGTLAGEVGDRGVGLLSKDSFSISDADELALIVFFRSDPSIMRLFLVSKIGSSLSSLFYSIRSPSLASLIATDLW